jgi:hypothetical protein
VDFLVRGEGCRLEITERASYRPFTRRCNSDEGSSVKVTVRVVSNLPGIQETMQPVLNGDDWWRMFSRGDEYQLRFHNRLDGTEYMVAQADRFTREVGVYLSAGALDAPSRPFAIADPLCSPLDQVLVMNHLAYEKGMIVHSAGIIMEGSALLFAGVSGAGKTTITGLFRSAAPDAKLLSDDRIIVRKTEGSFIAHGTPWPGDSGVALNDCERLKGVFFLAKAKQPKIVPLAGGQAVKRLFPVISCPWYDLDRFPLVLDTCGDLAADVPCFELQFSPDESVVRLLRRFVLDEYRE